MNPFDTEHVTPTVVFFLLFGGVGFFFVGASFLSSSLKSMAGPRLRKRLSGVTRGAKGQIVTGVLTGAVAQSSSVASFIMAGMISAGMISLRRAMPVVLWANVGTSALVFLATINLAQLSYLGMGLVGLGFYLHLQKSPRFGPPIHLILGLALIFIGISDTKAAAELAGGYHWFKELLSFAEVVKPLLVLISIGLAYVARSSASVSVIAIAFAESGLLTELDAVIMILGANIGSGLVSFDLSRELKGASKQLMITQALSKVIATAVFVPIIVPDVLFHWDLIRNALHWVSPSLAFELSVAFFLLQGAGAIVTHLFLGPVLGFVEKRWPVSEEAKWSELQYITPATVAVPESAPALITMEITRLASRMESYFEMIGNADRSPAPERLKELHEANHELAHRIDGFLREIVATRPPADLLQDINGAGHCLESVRLVDEELHDLTQRTYSFLKEQSWTPATHAFLRRLLEIKQANADLTKAAVQDGSREQLRKIADFSAREQLRQEEEMRDRFLQENPDLPPAERTFVINAVSSFGRLEWLFEPIAEVLGRIRLAKPEGTSLEQHVDELSERQRTDD